MENITKIAQIWDQKDKRFFLPMIFFWPKILFDCHGWSGGSCCWMFLFGFRGTWSFQKNTLKEVLFGLKYIKKEGQVLHQYLVARLWTDIFCFTKYLEIIYKRIFVLQPRFYKRLLSRRVPIKEAVNQCPFCWSNS